MKIETASESVTERFAEAVGVCESIDGFNAIFASIPRNGSAGFCCAKTDWLENENMTNEIKQIRLWLITVSLPPNW